MMNIQHEEGKEGGIFKIDENGKRTAELTYRLTADGKMDIDHTEVDIKFRGEGIGEDMVAAAVKHAKAKKMRIVATCPYAKKIIDETREFKDVLD